MTARTRLRLTLLLGALLSVPAVRTYTNGSIALDSAAIRVGIAMAFSAIAIGAIAGLLNAYAPKPPEEPDPSIEDADLVDDAATASQPDEPAL